MSVNIRLLSTIPEKQSLLKFASFTQTGGIMCWMTLDTPWPNARWSDIAFKGKVCSLLFESIVVKRKGRKENRLH